MFLLREAVADTEVVEGGAALCTSGTILNHISFKHLLAERSHKQL